MGAATGKPLTPGVYTVFGATGAQGGSVVRTLSALAGEGVTVRAVTRNAGSEKAKPLAALKNVTVVTANMDDAASVKKAVEGSKFVFAVTNYWEIFDVAKEVKQGKAVADACKAAGVEHVVFSGLENVKKLQAEGKLKCGTIKPCKDGYVVPHFDGKGQIVEYMRSLGLNVTNVMLAFYMENFIGFFPPKANADGTFSITLPMADVPLALFCNDDLGRIVATIAREGLVHYGKDYGLSGENLTVSEICQKFTKASGKTVSYNAVEVEAFKNFGFPGAEDLGNMFQFISDTETAKRDVAMTKKLAGGKTTNFSKWLKKNISKVPLAPAAAQ